MNLPRLIFAVWVLGAATTHAQSPDVPTLLQKYGCSSCHANDEPITGPAFVDVAAKYRDNPKAVSILTAKVRKGVHGGGPWPMPPSPQVSETDATKIVHYMLALRK